MSGRRRALAALALGAALAAPAACDATLSFEDGDATPGADGGETGIDPLDCAQKGCPLPSLHCEPSTHRCVECVSSIDCTAASSALPTCDTATHTCVECVTGGDCRSDETCVGNRCVRACPSGTGCDSEQICNTKTHACVQCTSDVQCDDEGLPHCDAASGRCFECVADAQCPSTHPRCDAGTRRCVECDAHADCAAGRLCDPTRHKCVTF
jgi:hypothetical protein